MTEAITNAAIEVLGKMKGTRRIKWFDEDCSMAVEKKKQLRLQTLQRHTRSKEVDLKKNEHTSLQTVTKEKDRENERRNRRLRNHQKWQCAWLLQNRKKLAQRFSSAFN